MIKQQTEQNIYYTLRIACAMCFIGHGCFGIITKAIWCNYLGVFGISHTMAYTLMPYVGIMDICMGLLLLLYPIKIVFGWLVAWGFITAALRPLSGEPVAEFFERAGNYGAPFVLLLLTYKKSEHVKKWFKPVGVKDARLTPFVIRRIDISLRIIVFLLLLGHGWLNLIEKKSLLAQYTSLGFADAIDVARIIGLLEVLAACSVLIKPAPSILLIFFAWKIMSELFYPEWKVFEFIERGGSYGTILALWLLTKSSSRYYFNNKQPAGVPAKL